MPRKRKPKKENGESDISTSLFRQMGLAEEDIKFAIELADKIEKKITSQKEFKGFSMPMPTVTASPMLLSSKYNEASRQDLLNIIEIQKTTLNYFQNVVTIQFVLLIKKFKDKLISLENKLLEQNVEITSLEKKVSEQKAEVEKLTTQLEFLLK